MTAPRATLPEPPKVELETASEKRHGEGGFAMLRRVSAVAVQGGERSPSFDYDLVGRRALDASAIVAHHQEGGVTHVWLRSSFRPPLALRPDAALPAVLWELPAGLIEPGETPIAAAARELGEELGFHLDASKLTPLGPPAYPAPAIIGEVHHYFHAQVDPSQRKEPEGDGSAIEANAKVIHVTLDDALAACARGELPDAKTELALRRFAASYPSPVAARAEHDRVMP